ncbi:MAG: FG-GAP-like repeat-containing protein, partial [Mucilaginibacter sp.]
MYFLLYRKPGFVAIFLFLFATKLCAQSPLITSFSPASGPIGSTVVINGKNFNATPSGNVVYFGAVKAKVTGATSNKLTVLAPAGATYQPVSVLNEASQLTGYATTPFIISSTSKHEITSADFDLPQGFPTLHGPVQELATDIDGDGKADVISVNRDQNTVSVYRNVSVPGNFSVKSFADPVGLSSVSTPVNAQVADLNGDGLTDIVVISGYSNQVTVWMNISTVGAIAFEQPLNYTIGEKVDATGINFLAIADIDKDGRPDLVLLTNSEIEKPLAILLNKGGVGIALFKTEQDFDFSTGASSLNIGDIDGDGLPDLLLTDKGFTIIRNLSSKGKIKFDTYQYTPLATVPVSASLGDLDNDGKPDIILSNPGSTTGIVSNGISVYRNTSAPGNISLAMPKDFPSYLTSYPPMTLGDIDGDGLPDIALTGSTGIQILHNTTAGGSISFSTPAVLTDSYLTSAVLSDLNNDGRPELLAPDFASNSFKVFQNYPQLPIINTAPKITSFSPKNGPIGTIVTITGTDFNTNTSGNIAFFGATRAVVNSATKTQLKVVVPAGASYRPISVLNTSFNLTGYAEAPFVTTFKSKPNPVNYDVKIDLPAGVAPEATAIADLDGDGKPDVVVVNLNGRTISLYRNISTTGAITAKSFAAKVDVAVPSGPISISIADINGDGRPDIVVGFGGLNGVSILPNSSVKGKIIIGPSIIISLNSPVNQLITTDVDGDGKPDIVAAINDNTVVVFRNRSVNNPVKNISFAKEDLDLKTGSGPVTISAADFDGDGKPDVVVGVTGAYEPGSVAIFRNTSVPGKSSFASGAYPNVGNWPQAIGVGDIDGDGKP